MTAMSATGSASWHRRSTVSPSQAGFSLVELLVVLVIMTLLAAIFPLGLQQMLPGRRLNAAKETLIANLRDLQSSAIASGTRAELFVEKTGYRLRTGPTGKELSVGLPAGIEMSLATDRIEFFEDGSSTGGRIELRDDKRASGLNVSRITGRISAD
jgi:general secretion pathway protein H